MPEEEKRCERLYQEWDPDKNNIIEKPCPHPYFGPGKNLAEEEIDCCIFHALMETKNEHLDKFWADFEDLFAQAEERIESAETEEEKKNVWLECYGFVFPDTGERFKERKFPFLVNMMHARFSGDANFLNARFSDEAFFQRVTFEGNTYFQVVQFSGDVDFCLAQFSKDAYFQVTQFSGTADFQCARFLGDADFLNVQFKEKVTFQSAFVTGKVQFDETEFLKEADFRSISTDKRGLGGRELGPGKLHFDDVYFHVPERVPVSGKATVNKELLKTDLSRWSFRGTNIEGVRFVEPCWPDEKERKGRKRTLDEERAEKGKISWAEAGEVYRKLRKNFEDNLAYEAASDFHVGQMECRLKDANRKLWDRGLTLAYKLVSGYGENIGRPFLWLIGFFTFFTGLFLITGFPAADGSGVDWAWGFKGFLSHEWWGQLWQGISFTLRSSVSFAVPRYTEGVDAKVGATLPALMFFWKVFAVTIVTFFVLALRRRFRR